MNLPQEVFDGFALGKSLFTLVKVCSVTTANNAHKVKQEATTIFVPEQRGNRMFQIKFPHPMDKCLSAVTFETR